MHELKSKSSKRILGRKVVNRQSIKNSHLTWEFKPKLQNMAVMLHSNLGIYDITFYEDIINDMRFLITRLIRNHGFNDGSERYKIIKDYTISLIEGRNPDNPGWLATSDFHRIPSALGINFIQLIVDSFNNTEVAMQPKYFQNINTILNIVRMVDGLVDADLQSVTTKAQPIDQELLKEFEDYVQERLSNINKIDTDINLFKNRFNLVKKGPNRRPKIESAIDEAFALLNSKLSRPFKIICEELNVNYLHEYLVDLTTNNVMSEDCSSQQVNVGTTRLRVLVQIPDSGFKTRLVAIVDFWTQLLLEPIRAHVIRVTESLFPNTDFRKSHDLGVSKMVEFQKRCIKNEQIDRDGNAIVLDTRYLRCYDIRSWTDRFHRDLQKITMKHLFSSRLSESWAQLVVHCEWYYPKKRRTVKYGQGQGMGTNGSFDIATLTDHLFINYVIDKKSSLKGYFPNNECYGKVGDDLWIYDPEDLIQLYYEKINLPINYSKSKICNGENSIVEFCSRTFLNSYDVSRISPKILSKSKDYRYMPILLGLCSSRGIQLDATSFKTLNNTVKGTETTYLDKLQDWIFAMLMISQYEQSPYWSSLTYEYLVTGNWVTKPLITQLFVDPKLLSRVMIGYSLITILENKKLLKTLLFDNVNAMRDWGDDIIHLTEPGTNLFDTKSHMHELLRKTLPDNIITPKQIVVLGRYVDQRENIKVHLRKADNDIRISRDPNDLVGYSRILSRLANTSCYDCGNINYDVDRIIGTQYKIVKVLERMNEDFTILYLNNTEELREIQELNLGTLISKCSEYVPKFEVRITDTCLSEKYTISSQGDEYTLRKSNWSVENQRDLV